MIVEKNERKGETGEMRRKWLTFPGRHVYRLEGFKGERCQTLQPRNWEAEVSSRVSPGAIFVSKYKDTSRRKMQTFSDYYEASRPFSCSWPTLCNHS